MEFRSTLILEPQCHCFFKHFIITFSILDTSMLMQALCVKEWQLFWNYNHFGRHLFSFERENV